MDIRNSLKPYMGQLLSPLDTAIFLAMLLLFYTVGLVIYRVYLSPLAKFPGPKLAAATGWYEVYFDLLYGEGGQFPFQIERLHKRYGPIIRINPWELHVNDPEYYETLYTTLHHFDKLKAYQWRLNAPWASFSTPEHDIHKMRRAAIAPFFTKRKVQIYYPFIIKLVEQFCKRLELEYKGTDQILSVNDLAGSLTADAITNYAFQKQYRFLDNPDFEGRFTKSVRGIANFTMVMTHLPWLVTIFNSMPRDLIAAILPPTKPLFEFQKELRELITEVKLRGHVPKPEDAPDTIFNELMKSNLPPDELTVDRLESEAMSIIGAGIETTKESLAISVFHIIANPAIHKRLRKELEEAIPDPAVLPELKDIEVLPYLGACVEEGIRLVYGVPGRSPRVSWSKALEFGDYTIPVGTPVSIQTFSMHHNEVIYPDSWSFKPERWLDDPRSPQGKKLSRYMASFGKGTRICAGMSLAYAELQVAIAALFRRFDFELYQTDKSAVELARVMFGPQPKKGTKGVRVLVK